MTAAQLQLGRVSWPWTPQTTTSLVLSSTVTVCIAPSPSSPANRSSSRPPSLISWRCSNASLGRSPQPGTLCKTKIVHNFTLRHQPQKWCNVCHFDFSNDIFRLQTQPPPRRDYFDICKLSRDIPIICKRKLRNTWLAGWQILLLQG